MSFIIRDELLNNLICSTCERYLSVKPIKIYRNGLIKCGRCAKDNDDGVVSLFGNIAENGLFPCINRYEGCNIYLTYSEVLDHENKCISGLYDCPHCPPDVYNPACSYQFLKHYKACHPEEILNSAEFTININEQCEKSLLYYNNDFLYIIYVRRHINEKYLLLNASNIGYKKRCKKIAQKVKLYTLDKKLLIETQSQPCSALDNNSNPFKIPISKLINNKSNFVFCSFSFDTSKVSSFTLLPNNLIASSEETKDTVKGLHNIYPKIYLNSEFQEAHPNFYLSQCKTKIVERFHDAKTESEFPRICDFCENIFQYTGETSNIYKCVKNHFICESCFNYNADCCDDGPYFYAEDESGIYSSLYFYCKWNCHRFYCGQDLKYHESRCRHNEEVFFNQEQIGKKYFGNTYSTLNTCLTKNTNVFPLDEIVFENVSKIFVITRDNFNFILHCLKDKNNLRFWFSHEYPNDKYYLLVRIKERHMPIYSRVNSFTLDANNRNIIFFSVVLRKV